ncbi:MAG: hypothetical protein GXY07_06825 [Candidatus Hydrogenedentes bacterium]|nr:hypothetical protein [Candidatus Hydrogenedentota bacterium]
MKPRRKLFVMALLIVVFTVGCARNRSSAPLFTDSEFSATQEDAQERLREIISQQVASESQAGEGRVVPVIHRRPYYFKEYSVYPDGPEAFEIEFRENDSRTRPLIAEVKLNKVRYSTQMHRKEGRAAADNNFYRDSGEELLVYEWHNGRWTRTGAIFNAQTTEEQVNGQWVPHKEETVRVNPEEEQRGWFGRMWERIRGGE